MRMCSYFGVISALPWTMVFCNTSECDADRRFLRADSNRARSLVTIAVQRRAVDPSIVAVEDTVYLQIIRNSFLRTQ